MTTEFFSTHPSHKRVSFQTQFSNCLARRPHHLHMVVPYIGGPPPWKSVSNFAQRIIAQGCTFQLITEPPETRKNSSISRSDADLIAQYGGTLIFRTNPTLHSKIYQFFYSKKQRAAFVGSANFSKGGFCNNDEAVAFSEEKKYNDAVMSEIRRLAGPGSIPFSYWRANNGKRKS